MIELIKFEMTYYYYYCYFDMTAGIHPIQEQNSKFKNVVFSNFVLTKLLF